ncbi:MAG: Coenzyme F420 hydrogenase/dehydrogenase, beta subunit C-terminal domain [Bacteroidales bacterium]|nr:Coenzyme F420 hydrogenase/dehydrogenase, beta subunit C-terminal domain [Bacteroidales bacterium]
MTPKSNVKQLECIRENYCIGCGVCTTTNNTTIYLDEYGKYSVVMQSNMESEAEKVLQLCPFSSLSENEDTLSKLLFASDSLKYFDSIGYFLNNYIGHVRADEMRLNSSSGGIITWLLKTLLQKGDITQAVHVAPSNTDSLLFEYTFSNDEDSIIAGASSRYYPVELSFVLDYIKKYAGKYAIVALPCFAKGLRLLQQHDKVFKQRIEYLISPICGHLKSKHYASFLAWQKGILPNQLKSINFRKKLEYKRASQYGTEFFFDSKGTEDNTTVENSTFKMGTDWGHGMFKYPACDYCDDVVGELADISVGDAWLQEYIDDYKGNSLIIVRNHYLNRILTESQRQNNLEMKEVSPELVEKSQAGGFRNKRSDLRYRLWLKNKNGEWYPPKRVSAAKTALNRKRRKIIKMRLKINDYSHRLFKDCLKKDDLSLFYDQMTPVLDRYFLLNHGVYRFLKRKLKKFYENRNTNISLWL